MESARRMRGFWKRTEVVRFVRFGSDTMLSSKKAREKSPVFIFCHTGGAQVAIWQMRVHARGKEDAHV